MYKHKQAFSVNMSGSNFGIFRPNPNNPAFHQEASPNKSLSDFLLQLEDYVSTVPDEVTSHFLRMGGFETDDMRIVRFISLAAQKYISDVANDAMQHSKLRTAKQHAAAVRAGQTPKERKYSMTMEDLQPALKDYEIVAFKPPYYS